VTEDDWIFIARRTKKRKLEGRESETHINGSLIPNKKVSKEISRYFLPSVERQQSLGNQLRLSPSRIIQLTYRLVHTPRTPQGITIRTPGGIPIGTPEGITAETPLGHIEQASPSITQSYQETSSADQYTINVMVPPGCVNSTPRPPYVGIINLGKTSYISVTLRLLYTLKPFRTVILILHEEGGMAHPGRLSFKPFLRLGPACSTPFRLSSDN
jgi:hypothetical protein